MGLDMYLEAERYFSRFSSVKEHHPKEHAQGTAILEQVGLIDLAVDGMVSVRTTVAYWRKANQIHGWFVENVQNGVDDCNAHYVPREKLEELRDLCQQVIEVAQLAEGSVINPTDLEALLPVREGFFFGGYEYDLYYLKELEHTVRELTRLLDATKDEDSIFGIDFYYRASW